MVYSSADMLGLIAEVFTRRAAMVCGKVAKTQGLTLKQFLDTAPKRAQEGLKLVGQLHHRYLKGHYQHDEKELLRIESYCNWLVEIAHESVGQVGRPIQFQVAAMSSKEPCKPKTYIECIAKVHSEW